MENKIKNKMKKKSKPKTRKKARTPAKRKAVSIQEPRKESAHKKESGAEAPMIGSVRPEQEKKEKDETLEAIDPKIAEEGGSHLAKWTAPSFILTNGEVITYKLSAAGSPFMIVWSLLQGNYIVSITFILAMAASVMHLVRKPEAMECLIDLEGIKMGDKLYKYNLLESFEVDEGSHILKFKLKNAIFPVKEIYLEDQDAKYIRAVLEYFLPEEKQEAVFLSREKKEKTGGEEMSDEEMLSYLEKMEKNIEKEES